MGFDHPHLCSTGYSFTPVCLSMGNSHALYYYGIICLGNCERNMGTQGFFKKYLLQMRPPSLHTKFLLRIPCHFLANPSPLPQVIPILHHFLQSFAGNTLHNMCSDYVRFFTENCRMISCFLQGFQIEM